MAGNETGMRKPRLRSTTVLLLWMAALAACVLALWAVPAAKVGTVRGGFGAIGSGSGPGATAAAHLCDDLADMDGRAATMLLIGDGTTLPQTRAGADQAYAGDLADADRQLELLGSGIGAIPGGAGSFVAVENQLNQYSQDIAQALYVDDQVHGQAPAAPPAQALARYQDGSALMNRSGTGLLADGRNLLAEAQGSVQARYDGAFATIGQLRLWTILLTVLVVLALLAVQAGLSRRFKRRINPPLALATVGAVIFGVLLTSALDSAHSDYVRQKADAYDSIIALWQSRTAAAEMNASQSRYLLDAGGTGLAAQNGVPVEQAAFDAAAQQTVAETGAADDLYRTDVDAQSTRLQNEAGEGSRLTPDDVEDGYLGRELANLTFPGEENAAVAAFQAYDRFIDDDANYRDLIARSGPHVDAAQYATAVVDRDYATYLADLDGAIAINQQQFAAAADHGGRGLGPWLWMPAGWALATAGLVLLGFLPRLREYRRS